MSSSSSFTLTLVHIELLVNIWVFLISHEHTFLFYITIFVECNIMSGISPNTSQILGFFGKRKIKHILEHPWDFGTNKHERRRKRKSNEMKS